MADIEFTDREWAAVAKMAEQIGMKYRLAKQPPMPSFLHAKTELHIQVTSDGTFTEAVIRGKDDGFKYHLSFGQARLHPDDEFDPQTGTLLAVARALYALGDQYMEKAEEALG